MTGFPQLSSSSSAEAATGRCVAPVLHDGGRQGEAAISIDRIAKLLQMAEGAKTAEEAAAFFGKAQALATAQEISLAEVRSREPAGQREQPVQRMVSVGRARQQANRHYLRLLVALARSNGCEIGLYSNNTAAVLYGLPSDIATIERMFAAIAPQMIRLGEAYLRAGSWRGELARDSRTGEVRQVTRQAARASFYHGFADTLSVRIRQSARQAREAAEQAERERSGHFHDDGATRGRSGSEPTGVALALRAKELEVRAFAEQHLSGGGTWQGNRPPRTVSRSSYRAGDRAARGVRLGEQPAIGDDRRSLGA